MDADTLTKVCKLIPRLASNHDGEVVATARAIERTLKAGKEDWHSLVSALNGIEAPQRALPEEPPIWEELSAGGAWRGCDLPRGNLKGQTGRLNFSKAF